MKLKELLSLIDPKSEVMIVYDDGATWLGNNVPYIDEMRDTFFAEDWDYLYTGILNRNVTTILGYTSRDVEYGVAIGIEGDCPFDADGNIVESFRNRSNRYRYESPRRKRRNVR